MIMAPMDEAYDIEELDREDVANFAKEFEKELRGNNFKDICKTILEKHATDKLVLFKDICEQIIGEDILSYLEYIPSELYRGSDIQSINIPKNIKEIKSNAFKGCQQLKTVTMPDEVEVIGESVFQDCPLLENVRLSEKLSSIPNRTFAGCKALTKLYIPDSVKRMGYDVFNDANSEMIVELNRGVDRSEGPDDEHPKAIKMKSSTKDFMANHLKWKNQ